MPIRISAEDSLGNYAERLIVIIFKKKVQTAQASQGSKTFIQQEAR